MARRPISRFPDLFSLRDGRWHMLDRIIANFPLFWQYFILAIAVVLVLLTLFALISLAIIFIKSFFKPKTR